MLLWKQISFVFNPRKQVVAGRATFILYIVLMKTLEMPHLHFHDEDVGITQVMEIRASS